jgi:mRNA interferase MazF
LIERGQFITVVVAGDYGKPRPALVVQSNLFNELPSVVVCPLTTVLRPDADQFRLDVMPNDQNGVLEPSQITIDKITVVRTDKIGKLIGSADSALMLRVSRALALFLGVV